MFVLLLLFILAGLIYLGLLIELIKTVFLIVVAIWALAWVIELISRLSNKLRMMR